MQQRSSVQPNSIRPLVAADLPAVDRLLQAAFGRASNFDAMLRLNGAAQPGNQLVATEAGHVVGTVGAVNFGTLAYVALMGVDPARHGRGIARQLMERVLARLDAEACPAVLLDATDAGAALYEKLGFVDDSYAYEYQQDSGAALANCAPLEVCEGATNIGPLTKRDLPEVVAFDSPRFGADRGHLLRILLAEHRDRALVARDAAGHVAGYAFARAVLGPWVARDAATAEQLFAAAMALPASEPVRVLVPRSNELCREILERHGLPCIRRLRHMRRGGVAPPGQPACLFGQVSFGLG